jgi:hypothetical protein
MADYQTKRAWLPEKKFYHSQSKVHSLDKEQTNMMIFDIVERDFKVNGSDPHRFDINNDGIGCESVE